jgi:hypothetical protein
MKLSAFGDNGEFTSSFIIKDLSPNAPNENKEKAHNEIKRIRRRRQRT